MADPISDIALERMLTDGWTPQQVREVVHALLRAQKLALYNEGEPEMPPVSVDELNQRLWNVLDRIEPYLDTYFPIDGPTPPDPGPDPEPGDSYQRPATSKGQGCFVVPESSEAGARLILCDGNGKPYRPRGTNKTHQDAWSASLDNPDATHWSNATRWIARQEPWIPYSPEAFIQRMTEQPGGLGSNCIQFPGFWEGTCEDALGLLKEMVDTWIAGIPEYTAIEKYMVLNIANEWGGDHEAWRDAYVEAVQRLRAAGWHGCIMVDAPGCGQDAEAIVQHGRAIFEADVEHNTLFSAHVYGRWYDSEGGIPRSYAEQIDLAPTMRALRDSGLCVIVGEYGPGRDVGPSPTMITPERLVTLAEESGFGWLSWSWDDWNQDNCQADDNSFCHTYDGNVDQVGDNLTNFGDEVATLWGDYKAAPASVFEGQPYARPPRTCPFPERYQRRTIFKRHVHKPCGTAS